MKHFLLNSLLVVLICSFGMAAEDSNITYKEFKADTLDSEAYGKPPAKLFSFFNEVSSDEVRVVLGRSEKEKEESKLDIYKKFMNGNFVPYLWEFGELDTDEQINQLKGLAKTRNALIRSDKYENMFLAFHMGHIFLLGHGIALREEGVDPLAIKNLFDSMKTKINQQQYQIAAFLSKYGQDVQALRITREFTGKELKSRILDYEEELNPKPMEIGPGIALPMDGYSLEEGRVEDLLLLLETHDLLTDMFEVYIDFIVAGGNIKQEREEIISDLETFMGLHPEYEFPEHINARSIVSQCAK